MDRIIFIEGEVDENDKPKSPEKTETITQTKEGDK